jgi:hypothetical protein
LLAATAEGLKTKSDSQILKTNIACKTVPVTEFKLVFNCGRIWRICNNITTTFQYDEFVLVLKFYEIDHWTKYFFFAFAFSMGRKLACKVQNFLSS